MLGVAGASAALGFLLTLVLPEPARRNLEEVSGEDEAADRVEQQTLSALGEVVSLPRSSGDLALREGAG